MEQLHIGICEDEERYRAQLLQIITDSSYDVTLEVHTNAEDLLSSFYPGKFDLLFMDIYMGGITGIEALLKIREADDAVDVAIITVSEDHALDAYRLRAARYLEKPLKENEVLDFLDMVCRKKEAAPHFDVKVNGEQKRIPFERISYIEQAARKLVIHVTGEQPLVVSGKLDEVTPLFPERYFFRSHKSFLVNLSRIRKLDRDLMTFVMEDGSQVHIRRQSFYPAKQAWEQYLFGIAGGWKVREKND